MTKKSKSRLFGVLITSFATAINLIFGGLVLLNITGPTAAEGIAFAGVLALGGVLGIILYLVNFSKWMPYSRSDIVSKRVKTAPILTATVFVALTVAGFLLRNFALSYTADIVTTYLIISIAVTTVAQFIADFFFHPQF